MKITSMKLLSLSALLLSTTLLGVAHAADEVLVSKSGMTLYTFDKDDAKSGKSTCFDDCASTWPPAAAGEAPSAAKAFGQIERPDGFKQLTINGKPLYFFAGDQKPGQTTGDNVGKVWHVVHDMPKAAHTGKCGSSY
jgi:predicted lipoprotein with Yx(FWY)xxD motif